MPLSKQLRSQLYKLSDSLAFLFAEKQPGETYHKRYQKDRKKFKRLIEQEISLEKSVRLFQKDIKKRLPGLVDWSQYQRGVVALADLSVWAEERKTLENILIQELEASYQLGVEYGVDQFRVPTQLSSRDKEFQAALRKRAGVIAQSVVKTIKDRLRAKLITLRKQRVNKAQNVFLESLDYPAYLDKNEIKEVEAVADNEAQAQTIGRTEIIAGIMAGLLLYATLSGAKTKTWRTVPGAEVICRELEGKKVEIDETFDSLVGPVEQPPDPHPNCRCYLDVSTK
jgi:hypothetical protein